MKNFLPFLCSLLFAANIALADPQATSSSTYEDPSPAASQDSPGAATFSPDEIALAMQGLGANANALGTAMAKGIASAVAQFGQPTGIIVGSEWQGSFFVGYRKGQGKLLFKGQDPSTAKKLYWEAPSIGFGAGFTASDVCILVYNTQDESSLLGSYGSAEGSAHWVAGGSISYLNNLSGNSDNQISLAHVGVGVGFDLTARVEDLTISETNSWLPF